MSSNNNDTRVLKGLKVKDTEQPPWGGKPTRLCPGLDIPKRNENLSTQKLNTDQLPLLSALPLLGLRRRQAAANLPYKFNLNLTLEN